MSSSRLLEDGEKSEKGEKDKHKLHGALKVLKDSNSRDDYWAGVECLEKMLLKVKNNPSEEKYRKLPIDEPWYVGKVGSLEGHEKVMEAAGFYPETDPEDGLEYYVMEASAEAWEELLLVGTIVHKTLKKKKSKKESMPRSSSKKSLKSSSSHHNSSDKELDLGKSSSKHRSSSRHSKKSRASNESSFEADDSAKSLFEDEHEGEQVVFEKSSSHKRKKKSKKKKSEDAESGTQDEKKKKSKKSESGSTKSFSSSSEEGGNGSGLKQVNSMGDSGESLTLDEAVPAAPVPGPPKDSSSKKKTVDPAEMSPVKGVTKAKFTWAMATSAVIEANRNNDMAIEIESDGEDDNDQNKVEKQVGNGTNREDLPLVSPKISSTAKKDYWKNAATQALLLSKMKEPELEEAAASSEDAAAPPPPVLSPVQVKGKFKNAMAKIKALETVSAKTDKEPQKERSRRGLWGRSSSSRSAGSSSSDNEDDTSQGGRRGSMGNKSGSRRGSRRKLNPEESRKRIEALEKGLSKHEIEEHRKMLKEQEEIRITQRKRLVEKIKREPGPRCTTLITTVSLLTAAELGLDLVMTSISFNSLIGDFECCGNTIESGSLTLGITIPYVGLILIELFMLACNVKQARQNSAWDKERLERFDEGGPLDDLEWFGDEDFSDDEEDWELEKNRFEFSEIMKWILIANPFLGCLITWVLLYEVSSEKEAFLILALEAGSIVLMFVTVYLEREDLTCSTVVLHGIPLFPFAATCFVVWYYLQKGGICFRDNNFWFDNCGMCGDMPLPKGLQACPNGKEIQQGEYCGEVIAEQFCYYSY